MLLIMLLILPCCIDSPATMEAPNEYIAEFELIWNLFDSKYVGFEIKDVDWSAVYEEFSQQANGITSDEEMLDFIIRMLSTLHDTHVNIINPEAGTVPTFEPQIQTNCDLDLVLEYLAPWGFQWMQDSVWGYCLAGSDSIPYFIITSWDAEINISLFDDILHPLMNRPGLIIDSRLCHEGADGAMRNLTRRFVDVLRTGYLQQKRLNEEGHELTAPEPIYFYPMAWQFDNSTVVLTGELNTGASELFACAMAELPHVGLIGDSTAGSANWPVTYWELPNDRWVTCPGTTFLRPDTTYIEGVGIPPDVYVEATQEDFASGVDPVLEYAFLWLGAVPPDPPPSD